MEELVFEDGSGLRGTDACVFEVRGAETGVWQPAEPGHTYANASGRPWIGCEVQPVLPDTAADVPHGLPLDGILFVLAVLAANVWHRVRTR